MRARKATLRTAHGNRDAATIDTALEALTAAWNAASQEIYAATQGEGGANPMDGFGGQPGNGQPNGNQNQPTDGDVSDVPYEEVK